MPFSADALSEPVGGDAVAVAARILRKTISVLLDEHPDALLQLTGGIDSRLLLAAIEPRRRSSVSVLTLRTAGSQDAAIAGSLAARWGMKHVLRDFAAVEALSPEEAFAACLEVTDRLDGAADPIAATAVEIAEHGRSPQARIVGLGGEVAQGFYYVGPLWADRVSTGRIHRFADWRVFANEAAPTEMLTREFSSWAVGEARRRVRDSFLEQPGGWFDRTDAFYLHQRMRRWAGGLASAWCMERADVNPMLDPRFVALVTGLRPSDKADLQFLARLLDHLDPELAALAMDGRPPPQAYLNTTPGARVALARSGPESLSGRSASDSPGGVGRQKPVRCWPQRSPPTSAHEPTSSNRSWRRGSSIRPGSISSMPAWVCRRGVWGSCCGCFPRSGCDWGEVLIAVVPGELVPVGGAVERDRSVVPVPADQAVVGDQNVAARRSALLAASEDGVGTTGDEVVIQGGVLRSTNSAYTVRAADTPPPSGTGIPASRTVLCRYTTSFAPPWSDRPE